MTRVTPFTAAEVESHTERLHDDGIIGLPGAFTRDWVTRLGEDIDTAFAEARARPDGAVGRGPNRFYVEIHPEQLRGFTDLATHPWITAIAEAVLGPEYRIVEVGFDVPLAGAADQPWHRDFPAPEGTALTSLAVNVTAVDTEPDMGPFEIAPARTGTTAARSSTACSRRARPTRATGSARRASSRRWGTSRSGRR